MRIVLVAVFFALVAAASAVTIGDGSNDAKDALAFIEGFALGVESQIGNVTLCTKDAQVVLDDFHFTAKLMLEGFRDKSVREVELALVSFGKGLIEVAHALKDCNVAKLTEELKKVAKDLQSGYVGIIKVIVKELINIFHHKKELSQDFRQFYEYFKNHKYELSGVKAGAITAILLGY